MSAHSLDWAFNVTGWLGDVAPGRMSPQATLIFWKIADYANGPEWTCAPTPERLAFECGISQRDAYEALNLLEELGIITIKAMQRLPHQRYHHCTPDGSLAELPVDYIRYFLQKDSDVLAGHPTPISPLAQQLKAQMEEAKATKAAKQQETDK